MDYNDAFYFTQHTILSRLQIKQNIEIRQLRFLLYQETNINMPKYGICKIFDEITKDNENEVMYMRMFSECKAGIIQYYYHYISDKIYLYMESCLDKKSLYELIQFRKEKKKLINHHLLIFITVIKKENIIIFIDFFLYEVMKSRSDLT